MSTIELEQVSKRFGSAPPVVQSVSLTIPDGEFMVLVGPSGCGKSTLLRMVAGLETVTDGSVRLGGSDVTHRDARERDIAMVFQNYALYPHMTVERNLGFGLRMRRAPKPDVERRVDDVAGLLGLGGFLPRRPAQLSGGQRQRVAIGRVMVRQPSAYLMDEPLSNLDAKLRVAMRGELARLHDRLGVTTIYVTHDQVEAMTLGQRVAVMRDGLLQQCDTPSGVFERPANLFVASFIGSPGINLVEVDGSADAMTIGGQELRLPPSARPAASPRRLILGIRPSDLELGAANGAPALTAVADVVENLGAERHVTFSLDAPAVLDEDAVPGSGEARLLAEDRRARWTVRCMGSARVRAGDRISVRMDPERLHFFDAETGHAVRPA
jgi:multiple sugar transport system ATP-binding protein